MVDPRALELKTQALLIRGLKQSWTEVTMNLDSQPNHPLAQITTVRQAHDPPYPPCPPCLRGYQKPRLLGERLEIFDADHARRLEHGVECGDPVERAAHRRLDGVVRRQHYRHRLARRAAALDHRCHRDVLVDR